MLEAQGVCDIADFRKITFAELCRFPGSSEDLAREVFNEVESLLKSL